MEDAHGFKLEISAMLGGRYSWIFRETRTRIVFKAKIECGGLIEG